MPWREVAMPADSSFARQMGIALCRFATHKVDSGHPRWHRDCLSIDGTGARGGHLRNPPRWGKGKSAAVNRQSIAPAR